MVTKDYTTRRMRMDELKERDLFAMLALVGLISRDGYNRNVPKQAYEVADAMIIAREYKEEGITNVL
jgi:hypothetical protein